PLVAHLDSTRIARRGVAESLVGSGLAAEALRLDRGPRSGLRSDLDLEVEEEAAGLLANRAHHLLEHRVALALVLDERVALGHGTKADAVLRVVHRVEVITPATVDDREHHPALELAQRRAAQLLLAALVGELRVGDDLAADEVAVHA